MPNDIALNIVKVSKYIFEKIALDIEDSDLFCKSLEQIRIEIKDKDYRDFNLDYMMSILTIIMIYKNILLVYLLMMIFYYMEQLEH